MIGTFVHTIMTPHASLNPLRIRKTCNLRNLIPSEYVLLHNFSFNFACFGNLILSGILNAR